MTSSYLSNVTQKSFTKDLEIQQKCVHKKIHLFIPYLMYPHPHFLLTDPKPRKHKYSPVVPLSVTSKNEIPRCIFNTDDREAFLDLKNQEKNPQIERHARWQYRPFRDALVVEESPPFQGGVLQHPIQRVAAAPSERAVSPPSANFLDESPANPLVGGLPSNSQQGTAPLLSDFDPEFQTYYYPTPHESELMSLAEHCQVQGDYMGISIGRKRILKNLTIPDHPKQRCDIICLIKKTHQVKLETQSSCLNFFVSLIFDNLPNFSKLNLLKTEKNKQLKLQEDIQLILKEKMKDWRYETFMIAGEKALLDLGFSDKDVDELHLVALFYKKAPIQS